MNIPNILILGWFIFSSASQAYAQLSDEDNIKLSDAEFKVVENTPIIAAINQECLAINANSPCQVRYDIHLLAQLTVAGHLAKVFTARPRCFSGDYEMSQMGYKYWQASRHARYYDAALFLSNEYGTFYLGKSCEKTSPGNWSKCAPEVTDLAFSQKTLPAILMVTSWEGADLGGKYTDIYYSTSGGKSWNWFPIPDSFTEAKGKEYCERTQIESYGIAKDSATSDWEINRKMTEYFPNASDDNPCAFPRLETTTFEVSVKDEVIFDTDGPKNTTFFGQGYSKIRLNAQALSDPNDAAVAFNISSGAKVNLLSRVRAQSGTYYWGIESAGQGFGFLREPDIYVDPVFLNAENLNFSSAHLFGNPKSRWVIHQDQYTCYDAVGTPVASVDSRFSGGHAAVKVSSKGDRLLYLEYNRRLHMMAADGCHEIFQLPDVNTVDADKSLTKLLVTDLGWRAHFYDSLGKLIADLGMLNSHTAQFSPSGRHILAYGASHCATINGRFKCFYRCFTYDVSANHFQPVPYSVCNEKTIDDGGRLIGKSTR